MTCEVCKDLGVKSTIRTPSELAKAIRMVRGSLCDGALQEVDDESVMEYERFPDLQEDGPWPDVIMCRFACTNCGAKFKLSVETYHGSGGTWSPEEAT